MEVRNRLLNYSNLIIYQNDEWFKFSLDSLLLATFVTINKSSKNILDLCTGNAPVPMLLSTRTTVKIYGVELQKEIFDLGYKSILENKLDNQIILINKDIKDIINDFKSDYFDVITCNPPYFKEGEKSKIDIKAIARHEIAIKLDEVLKVTKKLLRTGGIFALVHRTDRLIEIIEKMKEYNIEPKRIRFVYSKDNSNSDMILIEGIKGGKVGLKVEQPLIVHNSDGSYTDEVREMFQEKSSKC